MPKIERSVAYTFDAYSGGPLDDNEIDESPNSIRRNSQVLFHFIYIIKK